jgi:hypothetical protein
LPIELDTSNARWEGDVMHGHDLHLLWDIPTGRPFGDTYTVFVNGIEQISETYLYWSPRFQIGPDRVWSTFSQPGRLKDAPASGRTVAITVEVRASGDPSWVARKTIWVEDNAGLTPPIKIYGLDPNTAQAASAPAPLMTFAAPAREPEAIASAPDRKPEPEQTPEPEPEITALEPAPQTGVPGSVPETEPEPEPEPDVEVPVDEMRVEEAPEEATTVVALDGVSPEASVESVTVDDEPLGVELVDGVWQLSIPEEYWAEPREIVLTGSDEHGAPFTFTIRLTRDENGEISVDTVEPDEALSEEGSTG